MSRTGHRDVAEVSIGEWQGTRRSEAGGTRAGGGSLSPDPCVSGSCSQPEASVRRDGRAGARSWSPNIA
jgi:hypothetical protein